MTIVAVAMALLFALAPSTAAQTPPIGQYTPTFTRADLFLHRNTGAIGNLDAREGRFVRWDAAEPSSETPAVYLGNNYAWVVEGGAGNNAPQHFLTMQGMARGDLDNVAFDLYVQSWAQSTIGCSPVWLSFQLVVDGRPLLDQDYRGTYLRDPCEIVDETTVKLRFAFTNLWEASKLKGVPYGSGIEHDVHVNVESYYAGEEVVWMYDSVDRPSGLIVNLPDEPRQKDYFEIDVLDYS